MNLEFVRKHAVRQPNGYWCGPCALRHALLAYGERIRLSRIAKLAGTTEEGTDPWQLARAAESLDYSFGEPAASRSALYLNIDPRESYTDYRIARDAMRHALDEMAPVIVSVDARDHWVVVVHATSKMVTICDSSNIPKPIAHEISWTRLLSRMVVWSPGRTRFDLHPVRAR